MWVAMQDRLDTQLEPLGVAALDALGLRSGEAVLDIGCGSGQTTLQLAARVGERGSVIGVDISEPMLAAARRRAGASGVRHVEFICGDAQQRSFAPDRDAAYSRFGVMFFADPVAASRTCAARSAATAGSRSCAGAHRTQPAVVRAARGGGCRGRPGTGTCAAGGPGPFAFARRERIAGILEAAGFASIAIAAHDTAVGGNELDAALDLSLQIGPLGRLLRDKPQLRAVAAPAVRAALAAYVADGVVRMPSASGSSRRPLRRRSRQYRADTAACRASRTKRLTDRAYTAIRFIRSSEGLQWPGVRLQCPRSTTAVSRFRKPSGGSSTLLGGLESCAPHVREAAG